LSLVGGHWSSLDVTVLGNGDRHFFIGDQIFNRILGAQVGDFGSPGIAKVFLYCFELFGDYPSQRLLVRENLFKLGNQLDDRFVLVDDLLSLERRQPAQLQIENRLSLNL